MTWCNKFGIHNLFNDVPISLLSILFHVLYFISILAFIFLHWMWLRCIRSCIKDLSQGFLENRWLVHSQSMGLGNPLETIVDHLLIRGIASLDNWDGFPTVSALVCMVAHWTWPTMSRDISLSSCYDFTKSLHCVVSQPWENIELVLKLVVALTCRWDRKLIIYSLWIGSLLMEADSNRHSQ